MMFYRNMSKKRLSMTCYDAHEQHNINCMRTNCQRWIDREQSNNCIAIAVKKGPLTLKEIGNIYGLSRMRICQIEQKIYRELRNILTQSDESS